MNVLRFRLQSILCSVYINWISSNIKIKKNCCVLCMLISIYATRQFTMAKANVAHSVMTTIRNRKKHAWKKMFEAIDEFLLFFMRVRSWWYIKLSHCSLIMVNWIYICFRTIFHSFLTLFVCELLLLQFELLPVQLWSKSIFKWKFSKLAALTHTHTIFIEIFNL